MLVKIIEQSRSLEGGDRQAERESESSSMLVSLPVELQTEIMMPLTWKDILHMRMTCKLLSEVTKLRAIWAHLVEEHISTSPYPPRLERPFEIHTSTELERLLLLWKSADTAFAADHVKPVCERRFSAKRPYKYRHLVEGGRWFIIADVGGAVTYYDLDADEITARPLVPKLMHRSSTNTVAVSIDYDILSPTLKFTIAFYLEEIPKHTCSNMFQVWSVSLLLDSSHHGTGLVATRLAHFPLHPRIRTLTTFSVLESDLAFNGFDDKCGEFRYFIVCWRRANGRSTVYTWRMLQRGFRRDVVRLFPRNRLLVISSCNISLYDYTRLEDSSTEDLALSSPHCLWNHSFDCYIEQPIRRLFTRATTRITIVLQNAIYSIDIDNDPLSADVLPPMTKLLDINNKFTLTRPGPYLGYSRAIALEEDGHGALLLQYPSEDRMDVSHSAKRFSFKHPVSYGNILMDEATGRIVLPRFAPSKKRSVVIDLALSYKTALGHQ